MTHETPSGSTNRLMIAAVVLVLVAYAGALALESPQHATAQIAAGGGGHGGAGQEKPPVENEASAQTDRRREAVHPPFWTILPFAALLLSIAIFPLVPPPRRMVGQQLAPALRRRGTRPDHAAVLSVSLRTPGGRSFSGCPYRAVQSRGC